MLAEIVKWTIVSLMAFGALATVTAVGKPRKPITGGLAALTVALQAGFITAILWWWQ